MIIAPLELLSWLSATGPPHTDVCGTVLGRKAGAFGKAQIDALERGCASLPAGMRSTTAVHPALHPSLHPILLTPLPGLLCQRSCLIQKKALLSP